MNSLRITTAIICVLFSSVLFSQQAYFEKMPGVRTLEKISVSYDENGKARRNSIHLDSFDTAGNLVLRRYKHGGLIFEHSNNNILQKSIEFPNCISEIQVSSTLDTVFLYTRQIKNECNFPPPPPPFRMVNTYDSLFLNIARVVPNNADYQSLKKVISDNLGNKVTRLNYVKSRSRKPSLELQSIEQATRIDKNTRIVRSYFVDMSSGKILLDRQEVLDNNNGSIKSNHFDGMKALEWFDEIEYPGVYKYKLDKKKNWTARMNKKKSVLEERKIEYY